MAQFKVTPENLLMSASNIKSISADFTAVMSDIEKEMNNMKKKWESEAANAFLVKFLGLKDNFDAYYKVINSYANFLNQTAQAYKEAEKEVRNASKNLFS